MKKFLFLLLSAVTASVFGAMPPDSIIIEAESLKPENKNWVVRDHFLGWYAGKPSKGRMLNGFSKRPGSASGSFINGVLNRIMNELPPPEKRKD